MIGVVYNVVLSQQMDNTIDDIFGAGIFSLSFSLSLFTSTSPASVASSNISTVHHASDNVLAVRDGMHGLQNRLSQMGVSGINGYNTNSPSSPLTSSHPLPITRSLSSRRY